MTGVRTKTRFRSMFLGSALVAGCCLLVPYGLSRVLSPWRTVSLHSANPAAPAPPSSSNVLRLACYNIAHGRGNGPASENWTDESRSQRLQRLQDIAAVIRSMDADVVVLNEVDFDSSWSRGINQARKLATLSGYGYWAEQRNLDFRVLLWKWRFGNAVLSKHPITNADTINLPGYSTLETLLAGKTSGVACDIQWKDQLVRVAAVHLSHRTEHLRVKSADLLADMATITSAPFFVIGDMNSTPPEFSHSVRDDDERNAIAVLDDSRKFRRAPMRVPDAEGMTFDSLNPRAVIDWILIPHEWDFRFHEVVLSDLSEHRPVHVEVFPPAK